MSIYFIEKLTQALRKPLPGKNIQRSMMIQTKTPLKKIDQKKSVPSAVLLLLFPQKNDWFFFLTKRTDKVEHHKGQISLPGGVVEYNETFEKTALRETYEEIGVPSDEINLVGALSSFYIPISGFEIFPFVGWIKHKPKTTIQEDEVQELLSVSLKDLLSDKSIRTKTSKLRGSSVDIPYFHLCNEMVWGATSMILAEFKAIIKEAQ